MATLSAVMLTRCAPAGFARLLVLLVCVALAASCAGEEPESAPIRLMNPVTTPPVPSLLKLFEDLGGSTGIRVQVLPSIGSAAVVTALQRGESELGLAQADTVYEAYSRGLKDDSGPSQNLRGVAVGGLTRLFVCVRAETNIFTMADLRGHRIAVSPPASSGELLTRRLLEVSGLTYADMDVRMHQPREMGRFVDPEQLDGMILLTISDPETLLPPHTGTDFRVIALPREIVLTLRGEYPFLRSTTVHWPTRAGLPKSIETVGVDSVILANKNVPDDLVYRFTAGVMAAVPSNNPFEIDPDLAPTSPIPLHPGAARYYREVQLLK